MFDELLKVLDGLKMKRFVKLLIGLVKLLDELMTSV